MQTVIWLKRTALAVVVAATMTMGTLAVPLYQCPLTVGGYAEDKAALTNFPVLVRISTDIDKFDYGACAAGGADISFTGEDGETVYPHEVDTWNSDGESLVWVKLPGMAHGTRFLFRWSDPNPPANDPTAVWADYIGVWHFSSLVDSTNVMNSARNDYNLRFSASGVGSIAANAPAGTGLFCETGTVKTKDYEPEFAVGANFTATGWFYLPSYAGTSGKYAGIVSKKVGLDWNANTGWYLQMNQSKTTIGLVESGSTETKYTKLPDVTQNWNHFAMISDGTYAKAYFNGSATAGINRKTVIKASSTEFQVGTTGGYFDEYRLRKGIVSTDWVGAEYATVAMADYLTAGTTEVLPTEGIVVTSDGRRYGEVSPAYGLVSGPVDGTQYAFSCTVETQILNEAGTTRAVCTGWSLHSLPGGEQLRSSMDIGESVSSCTYTYVQGTGVELRWHWQVQHKVAAAAAPGGEVSATTQWIADCESAEITATPDADCSFFRWSGSSESQENPLVIPSVTAPMSLTALFGRSICVSTNGSDEAAGTASAPYRTPEMAIGSAPDGSVITIGEGTYYLTKELFVTNAIRVVGAGRDKTFLDAQLKRRVMTIDSDLARVSGVTIRNGATTSHGGGVKIIGKGGVLEDCTVTVCNDTQYDPAGGGIYMSSAKGVISRCIIKGNSIPRIHYSKGGGVWMNAGRMDNCLIVGNTSNSGTAGTGAAIFADGSAVIRNCTIVDNETTTAKCGGLYANNANVRVINCVLWGNRSPKDTTTGAPDWREASAANFDHCVAPTRPSGADCKDDDPSFKGAASGDYTFYSSSSLRNAGKDLADIGELDLNGNPRKSGQIDVGCYEFDESQKEVSFGVVPLRTLVGGAVAFSNASVGFSDAATYAFTLIDEHGTETAVPTADEAGFTSAAPGLYSVRLVVTEGGQPYELTLPGHLLVAPLTNYVDVAATAPRSPYGTPATAATNVLDVIPYAMDGSTVFVKDGLYKLWKEVRLDDAITMISENGAERTILKRVKSNNYRPLRINHAQALVRGFTMTGGEPNDAGGGGVLIDVHGGTLEDSIVTNNSDKVYDSNGGGVYIGNNGYVRRCLIGWNRLSSIHYNYGGGVRMGNGLLEDCLVISNRTLCNDSRPEAGGGVYATGGKVRNCTIIGNQSYNTAGGLYQGSGVEVYNCVIRDNFLKAGTSGATMNYSFADLAKVWNCAMEIPAGSNCVTNEPAFVDAAALDFHLASESPLVNAGTNVNYTAESLDLDRHPRIFEFGRRSSRPDIGCYESPYGKPGFSLILR